MQHNRPAIIVMAKVPRAGQVKTRLQPILSETDCAELSECFLLDTVDKVERVCADIVVAYTPADGRNDVERLFSDRHLYFAQEGSVLGERIGSAIQSAMNRGLGPLVVIGTDSPTLPASYIETAFNHITAHDGGLALGPTDDGGYYLIGTSRLEPGLFSEIKWSTDRVFQQTITNAKKIGLDVLELARWYDVDEPADLERLYLEFQDDNSARELAPNTFRWLTGYRALFSRVAPDDTSLLDDTD